MRWLAKERFRVGFFKGQRGFTLIETLIAVGILGALGVGLLMALDTNSRAARTLDEQVTGVNLATAYLEAIRELAYDNTENPYSSAGANITRPTQYGVVIDADYSDDGTTWADNHASSNHTLQRITISVSRDGGKPVFSTCTFRAER